jgi:hypothetical protein
MVIGGGAHVFWLAEEWLMKIKVPRAAAESGTLRIWLRRIPVSSDSVYAFRQGPDGKATEEVARADVYGRGEGSAATERIMLQFRFRPIEGVAPPHAGEELDLRIADHDGHGYVDADLDILQIE